MPPACGTENRFHHLWKVFLALPICIKFQHVLSKNRGQKESCALYSVILRVIAIRQIFLSCSGKWLTPVALIMKRLNGSRYLLLLISRILRYIPITQIDLALGYREIGMIRIKVITK